MRKRVAAFLHTVGKTVVARVEDPRVIPRIGTPLFDRKGRKVGHVADVIGNVRKPYLVVRGSVVEEYYSKEKFLQRGDVDE